MISISLAALAAAVSATPDSASIEPIVVTASRSGDGVRADLLGSSVTVLDAQALDDRQTRVVSDILRDVPGVAVSRTGGVGGFTQVRIRGAESNHTLTLIDGIEVSDPYQGEFDYSSLIADDVAKVEVLRGQQSALYGSDAIGGVIQYITLTGREAPGFSARAEGGSFGTFSAAARAAGVSGALDYALSASYLTTDGAPTARNGSRDIGDRSIGLSFKSTLEATDNLKFTAVGRYSDTHADTNDSSFAPGPLFGFIVDTPDARATNRAFYGLVKGELSSLDDRLTNALSAQIADTKRDGFESFGRSSGDKGLRTKASYEGAFRFGSDNVRQRVTVAVDAERERYENTDPSGFAFTGKRHVTDLGLVGQYDVTIADRLALGAAIRHDDDSKFANATTYRLQASYRFDTGTRLRAAAGSGIKNPGFYELYGYSDGRYIGNPDLQPEKSKGWEAGVEQSFADDRALVGVTYFHSNLHDEIVTAYPAPAFVATPTNSAAVSRQRGVEAFAQARLGGGFRFDAAYTHLHAREAGLEEVRRAPNIASANLDWRAPDDRFGATLTVRYNGDQKDLAYTSPTFVPLRVTLDNYTLVNLAADFKVNARLSVFGRVENLLDETYEDVFSYATPGRAAYAGLKVRF